MKGSNCYFPFFRVLGSYFCLLEAQCHVFAILEFENIKVPQITPLIACVVKLCLFFDVPGFNLF